MLLPETVVAFLNSHKNILPFISKENLNSLLYIFSYKHRFKLISTDCLHLNSKGAIMISDLISGFLSK
jgi:hypothetical protein